MSGGGGLHTYKHITDFFGVRTLANLNRSGSNFPFILGGGGGGGRSTYRHMTDFFGS